MYVPERPEGVRHRWAHPPPLALRREPVYIKKGPPRRNGESTRNSFITVQRFGGATEHKTVGEGDAPARAPRLPELPRLRRHRGCREDWHREQRPIRRHSLSPCWPVLGAHYRPRRPGKRRAGRAVGCDAGSALSSSGHPSSLLHCHRRRNPVAGQEGSGGWVPAKERCHK